jgi:hypothetical protein
MNKYDLITSINTSSAQNSGGMLVVVLMGIITNDHQWCFSMTSHNRGIYFLRNRVQHPCPKSPGLSWQQNATYLDHSSPIYIYYFIFMYHIYPWFEHVNMLFSPNILLPRFPHLKGKAGAASGFPRRGVAVLPWPICVCRSWRRTSAQGWAEIFAA